LNRIKIDLDRRLGTIDRGIFGGFVEHLGRCVYGGIFDPDSPLADANGLRAGVVGAVGEEAMLVAGGPARDRPLRRARRRLSADERLSRI
jgi:hypothetical protein